MTTYRETLKSYASLIHEEGPSADADLSAGQRKLLRRLLLVVASDDRTLALGVVYPPSDRSREDVVALVHDYLTRTLASAEDFGLDMQQWDATVSRAIACIRNV